MLLALNRDDCESSNKEIYLRHESEMAGSNSSMWVIKSSGVIANVGCKDMVISFSTNNAEDIAIKQNAETDGWVQVRDSFH